MQLPSACCKCAVYVFTGMRGCTIPGPGLTCSPCCHAAHQSTTGGPAQNSLQEPSPAHSRTQGQQACIELHDTEAQLQHRTLCKKAEHPPWCGRNLLQHTAMQLTAAASSLTSAKNSERQRLRHAHSNMTRPQPPQHRSSRQGSACIICAAHTATHQQFWPGPRSNLLQNPA